MISLTGEESTFIQYTLHVLVVTATRFNFAISAERKSPSTTRKI